MNGDRMQAVHDDDLVTLLKSLGVYEKFSEGQFICRFCQKPITVENLGAIIPVDGKIAFSCDAPKCIDQMAEVGVENEC